MRHRRQIHIVMSIKTDDEDIRDTSFWMELGGNGDYYINLMENGKRMNFRCAMSGGNCPTEVKFAIAKLYQAMEMHGLNLHPKDSILNAPTAINPHKE